MDLSLITVADFKAQFRRDFAYLPVFDITALYNAGAEVYYPTTALFYKAKANGTTGILPTVGASWDLYSDDVDNFILDEDITKAFAEAKVVFNQALLGTDDEIKLTYLYLTAHYLVNDIRTSLRGLESNGEAVVSSRTVGSVSEAYAIPTAWTADPILNFYTKSGYGLKYLSLVTPKLVGNVGAVGGWTLP